MNNKLGFANLSLPNSISVDVLRDMRFIYNYLVVNGMITYVDTLRAGISMNRLKVAIEHFLQAGFQILNVQGLGYFSPVGETDLSQVELKLKREYAQRLIFAEADRASQIKTPTDLILLRVNNSDLQPNVGATELWAYCFYTPNEEPAYLLLSPEAGYVLETACTQFGYIDTQAIETKNPPATLQLHIKSINQQLESSIYQFKAQQIGYELKRGGRDRFVASVIHEYGSKCRINRYWSAAYLDIKTYQQLYGIKTKFLYRQIHATHEPFNCFEIRLGDKSITLEVSPLTQKVLDAFINNPDQFLTNRQIWPEATDTQLRALNTAAHNLLREIYRHFNLPWPHAVKKGINTLFVSPFITDMQAILRLQMFES